MSYVDFSSWPREQEHSFVVYEQHAADSQKRAVIVAAVSSLAVLILALGIYVGVEPDKKDLTKGMNMSNLTKKSTAATAPAPTPDPAAGSAAAAPAPAPAGSGAPAAAPAPAGSAAPAAAAPTAAAPAAAAPAAAAPAAAPAPAATK